MCIRKLMLHSQDPYIPGLALKLNLKNSISCRRAETIVYLYSNLIQYLLLQNNFPVKKTTEYVCLLAVKILTNIF